MIKKRFVLTVIASAILVACGDGGSDSGVQLSGTASKGALDKAVVAVCKATSNACLNADVNGIKNGNVNGLLAKTISDKGKYEVTIDYTGPVVVRFLADENTRQECDYDGCDPNESLIGLELSTVTYVDAADGGVVDADVSVLTTLATDSFIKTAGDTLSESVTPESFAASQKAASNAVATLLGIDKTLGDVSIFDIPVVTASTTGLATVTAEAGASADVIKQLSVLNASFGALIEAGGTNEIKQISERIATIVESISDDLAKGKTATQAVAALNNNLLTQVTTALADIQEQATNTASEVGVTAVALNDSTTKLQSAAKEIEEIEDTVSTPPATGLAFTAAELTGKTYYFIDDCRATTTATTDTPMVGSVTFSSNATTYTTTCGADGSSGTYSLNSGILSLTESNDTSFIARTAILTSDKFRICAGETLAEATAASCAESDIIFAIKAEADAYLATKTATGGTN